VRKRGGSYRASSNPWNGAGTPVGAMTGTGVITSATAECPRLDAGGSARSPSAVCVEWQQSQPRARPGPQLVAQQAAARSCAVSSLGAASATWALSAAATTATNAERIPFRRTDITLPPAMSRHKRGFLPARRPLLEAPASKVGAVAGLLVRPRERRSRLRARAAQRWSVRERTSSSWNLSDRSRGKGTRRCTRKASHCEQQSEQTRHPPIGRKGTW
jgi:hypothetical protein